MREQHPFIERFWRPAAAILAATALTVVAGCSTQPGENPGPSISPGMTHSASPIPGASMAPGGMSSSSNEQLRRLASYENELHHVFGEEMLFTDMPRTEAEAQDQAASLASTLKEFHKYDVKPLIIMEPTNNDGGNISLDKLHAQKYERTLDALFQGLKDQGITEEEMGTLIPVPEANLPSWGGHSTDPELFAENFAAIGGAARRTFPGIKLGILLNSASFPSGDVNFMHGDSSLGNLMRYVDVLKNSSNSPKVNELMIEGFPFSVSDNPHDYLNGHTITALAEALGVDTVVFHTGTAQKYKDQSVPESVRERQMAGELSQAEIAKKAGIKHVVFSIFAGVDPGSVDWRYPVVGGNGPSALPRAIRTMENDGIQPDLFVDNQAY